MPEWRICETIPPELGLFELVVIDEASQSDIWALPALLRGKKLLVVVLNAGPYVTRGMAYLALDFPGQGGALRMKDLHLPPDTERIAKAMIDYLVTRPDVEANRIGMQGISMGGYGVPRAASGES
jgi:hypothetical protein